MESVTQNHLSGFCQILLLRPESYLKCSLDYHQARKRESFENIKKVISASNNKALLKMNQIYGSVVKAGIYNAPSIKVAEAAKVIENSQRDLNIAFINEL